MRRWVGVLGWVGPVVVLLAVSLPHLNQGDFRGDTGWYSAVGLSSWRSGSLWTLEGMPGQPYFNKPPLGLWVHGLALHVLGPSVWAARLLTVLAAALAVVMTNGIGRAMLGRRAGVMSAFVLALTLEFFRRTREVSLDVWQLAFLLAALWLVVAGARRGEDRQEAGQAGERAWWTVAAGVPLGLALLCKPLTALAMLPMAGAMLWALGSGRRAWWLLGAAGVAVLVAGPWHLSMWLRHGDEFVRQYLAAEVIDRAAGRLEGSANRESPWWFYLRQIGTAYWPWLACVVLAGLAWDRFDDRRRRGMAAAGIWAAAWLMLVSVFPDRRDRYALPIYPGLAWVAGVWLASPRWEWLAALLARARWRGPIEAAVVGVVFAALPIRIQSPPAKEWEQLHSWTAGEGLAGERVWLAGQASALAARLYLRHGWWPRATMDRWGAQIGEPGAGAVVVYHRRCGLAPGPGETVAFEAGDVRVTRLDAGEWRPMKAADPGEK
ncbi:MAG: ArnT family glycosyltransferase [Phycisphaerales bacterium]